MSGNFASISIEYLHAGLVLQEDIYNYNGTILMLPKGNTLTDVMIEQLKKFNNSQKTIRVSRKFYEKLLEAGMPKKFKQAYLEDQIKYTEIKEETKKILKLAEITSRVPYEQVCDINELLTERLELTEPALLFQCINGHNEVDEYLYRHSVNVGIINGLMGKWLGLTSEDISNLTLLGLVHDVGKTKIPSNILNSPNKLTDKEFDTIKRHTVYSYEILLNDKKFDLRISEAARRHHEKMNGTGYPDALSAEEIPLYARITAISDVYDAMVSRRSYKEAQSPFVILKQMQEERFWGLDIRLVNLFAEMMPRELLGQSVLMSDGTVGTVKHVGDLNMDYPIVEIDGEVKTTNRDFYCVSMVID